jgi:putative DNA primase/helicase
MSIQITKGLKSRINARAYTIDQALSELRKFNNNYELMSPVNRIYGDIDCKGFEGTEEEFKLKDQQTLQAIRNFLKDEPRCLMTASSWEHRIISWRFVLTKRMCSIEDNKQWVINEVPNINLPEGVCFDSAPYASKNQKIRMLGSSKDGENRPLVLVEGSEMDSLITHTEGCELKELPKVKKSKKKVVTTDTIEETLLEKLVMNIENDELTTWEQWYKVAQAIFNENGSEDLFLRWSEKSPKHNVREAMELWRGLKKREDGLTAGSLYYWSNQSNTSNHEHIILTSCDPESYAYKKVQFEKTHFKVMFPSGFGYTDYRGDFHLITLGDLAHQEKNNRCGDKQFLECWTSDPYIRTYQSCVFKPKLPVRPDEYNLWADFGTGKPGDVSVVREVLLTNCGNDEKVREYVEKWCAWIVQNPSVKTKTCIIFQSDTEGAGKDTYGDFYRSILGGEYSFNTLDAENEVFSRFNSHLKKCLFIKFEEAPFIENKNHRQMFKGLVTTTSKGYEEKGHPTITLDCYFNIMMTTNNKVPALLDDKERRMVLIKCSEERVGQMDYWKKVHQILSKQETKDAWLHYLLNLDLTGWNAYEQRPITKFYEETKLAGRPYHARFFQNKVEDPECSMKEVGITGKNLLKAVNEGQKHEVNETQLGRDLQPYIAAGVITKRHTMFGNNYRMTEGMGDYLKQKGWWVDL